MQIRQLVAMILALAGASLQAQTPLNFDGNWVVTWEGKSSMLEAKMSLNQDSGTWNTAAREKNNPCVGREVPVRIDERSAETLKLTLRFSEIIPGCNDSKVSLFLGADGTVSGKRGNAELKVVRAN